MEYTYIRSKRKTIGITIKDDGSIILRAPYWCSKKNAEKFLYEKKDWIEKTQKRLAEKRLSVKPDLFTEEEMAGFRKRAGIILPPMVKAVAEEMGVDYGRISIRAQKTRWGSCSVKGNLNFNCLLVLMPDNVIRYVIVHELSHRKHLDHSKAFWAEVEKYQPSYKSDRKQLRTEGDHLIESIP